MLELKPKMFKESEKSNASENLVILIMSFLFIFGLIFLAEAVIPWLLSKDELNAKLTDFGYYSGAKKLNIGEVRDLSMEVSMQPKIFIPTLLCTGFGTLISIIYCRFFEARPMRSMGFTKEKALTHYLRGLLTGAVLMSAITLLSVICRGNNIALCSNINFGLIGLYFLGFLVQGMSEEVIFRGFLMNTIAGRFHAFIAIGISAVAFSLAHVMNPGFGVLVFINLAMFGVFASLYMIAFDDIWGACAIHSVWNFTQGSFYGISVSGSGNQESVFRTTAASSSKLLTGGDFGIEGSIFTTVVLAAGIAAVIFKLKKAENKPE